MQTNQLFYNTHKKKKLPLLTYMSIHFDTKYGSLTLRSFHIRRGHRGQKVNIVYFD